MFHVQIWSFSWLSLRMLVNLELLKIILTKMKLLNHFYLVSLAIAFLSGCSGSIGPEEAGATLEAMLRKTVAKDDSVRNAVLLVEAPELGINGVWAEGIANERSGTAMTFETPFLSASIGKLFTATLVVLLAEEGLLSLDDSIVDWLDSSLIAELPVEGGDVALSEVTIRRLLGQRSGLPDYFEGQTADGTPNVLELLTEDPERTWTPILLLDYTKAHYAPAAVPGETFLYADTNYDLLGLIVEAASGRVFNEFMEERIFSPLGLQHTWMHAHSTGPTPYADVWIQDYNVARSPSLSMDWAGGGLATTVGDLRTLLRSLLDGRPTSLEIFKAEWTENAIAKGIDYGYSLWRIRPEGLSFLLKAYPELLGISGSTGSFLYWVPKYDAVITGSFNQTDYKKKHVVFLIKVLKVLSQVAAETGS
jgi:D-alanyl-D-alanine carboxypeptidase